MKFLFDLFPLLLFFAALKVYDIYAATAVAIAASFVQVGFFWLKHRRVETMHVVTLVIIAVFGSLTLILHDATFIKWKPTVVYWIFTVILFYTQFFTRQTAYEHLLGKQLTLPASVWLQQNRDWGIFFLLLGVLNLYVAFWFIPDFYAELDSKTQDEYWGMFKVFGTMGLTLAFTLLQAVRMAPYLQTEEAKKEDDNVIRD
jgi:intracellular septation protein